MATWRSLPAETLRRLEELAGRPLGGILLFVLALAVYAVEAVAWPLSAGRDLDDYLRYYVQILDGSTLLPAAMLFRTPVVPIVDGLSLDVAGGHLAEPAMAVLYGGSIVAWSAAARAFGPRAAIATALVLLVYPGYGAMFHELASEPVFAAAFAGWALLVTRVATRPTVVRFALVGLGIALLSLIRPGNQILVLFCLFPLALPGRWRKRLAWAGATLAAVVVPLGLFAVYNGFRYGDYTVARGGPTAVPFYRAFVTDRIVSPENGSGSRKLADAIRRHLITRQPYRGYGVSLDEVFSSGSVRIAEDLNLLSDEVFGWESNYSTIGDAGLEAVREHPGTYASGVAHTIWSELWSPFYRVVSQGQQTAGGEPPTVVSGRPEAPASERRPADPAGAELLDLEARPLDPRGLDLADPPHLRVRPSGRPAPLRADPGQPRPPVRRPPRPLRELHRRALAEPGLALVSAADSLARPRSRRARPAPAPRLADARRPRPRGAARTPLHRSRPADRPPLRAARRARVRVLRRLRRAREERQVRPRLARGRPAGEGARSPPGGWRA